MAQSPAQQVLELTHPTAETTVLTAMRRGATEDAVHLADTLSSADFADPRNRVAFQAMVNVLRSTEPLDDTNILAECPQVARDMRLDVRIDGGWLAGLDGDPLRARAYAQTVKRLAYLRSGADFAYWFVGRLQERADPDQLFTEAQERIQALQPPSKTQRFVYGWDTVQAHRADIAQRVKDAAAGKVNPFLWPWASWNGLVRPLRPGMLGLVAGADGTGKSTYLEMIAEHWALGGMHVVYVHLEDALDYKLDRRLARWARVPLQALEDGTTTAEQRQAADVAQEKIDRNLNTLHYFDAAGMSAAEIVTELKARVGEGVCQAVVLDYLDKMQPSRAQAKLYGDQIWERQSNDVETLKTFAERHSLPIMTASQGNKGMQQQTGTRTRRDIQGSGAKTQKAQLVAILTRELVGDDGLLDSKGVVIAGPGEYSPFIDVRIDKQNRGKTGVTMTQFLIGQFFDIRDVEVTRQKLDY
jgi:replicative DNA helicase